jgi:6-pyruvoyltetrahydropterin/6-carboxytetrahydropterin synthase
MQIAVRHNVEMGHRLLHHEGKCAELHGHSYGVEVVIEGEPDPKTGILVDYGVLKPRIRQYFDTIWDHAFAVNLADKKVLGFLQQHGFKHVTLAVGDPTAENLANAWLEDLQRDLADVLPDGACVRRVRVSETGSTWAEAVA